MPVYFNGVSLGFSLIMALGPQNMFLIKQGARKNHAGLSAMLCFFCDLILVTGSVVGLGETIKAHPALQAWMVGLGSLFLIYYAIKTLKCAFTKKIQSVDNHNKPLSRKQIVLLTLSFSLLNPHAIVDSLVIIGSSSSQFSKHQMAFLLGVLTASLLWFSSLTITTRYFSNLLTRHRVWQLIEVFSGVLMIYLGIKLAFYSI